MYPTQGAGRIVGETKRTIAGKTQVCLEIELLRGSMKVLVPLAQADKVGLRRITDKRHVPKLLRSLNAPDLKLAEVWTPRHRQEQLILSEGSIFEVAELVGTLSRRDFAKPLSGSERRVLDDAKQMVLTEIAVAVGLELTEAEAKVNAALAEAE